MLWKHNYPIVLHIFLAFSRNYVDPRELKMHWRL